MNLSELMTSRPTMKRRASQFALCLALASSSLACHFSAPKDSDQAAWDDVRKAESSDKADKVALWLEAEMLRPGGSAAGMKKARTRLDSIKADGVVPALLRGMMDAAHGRSILAADHFFAALLAARDWDHPDAQLYAWFAAKRAEELSGWSPHFAKQHRADVDALLDNPGNIGFRAYSILVNFWADNAFEDAQENIDDKLAARLGCTQHISIAGPFGANSYTDILRSFEAEQPGLWPERFPREEGQYKNPRLLKTDRSGCDVFVDEPVRAGIFYAQSFVELEKEQTLLLAAGSATQMWINDKQVQNRDLREWGSWPRWGVQVTLPEGRHRIVWKTASGETTLRLMDVSGKAAAVRTSQNQSPGYSLVPPLSQSEPNVLMRFIKTDGVTPPKSDLTRFVAAYLADDEGESDVAAVLFEPLVEKIEEATGVALNTAAIFVGSDPIYDESQTRDLVHELELRAAEKDPELWYPAYQNIVWEAEQKGATSVVADLEKLQTRFADIPTIPFTLAQLYDELDWGPEQEAAVKTLLERFPNDEDAIKLGIDLFEEAGDTKKVDELLNRLLQVNPDSELLVTRALNQRNYQAALKELKRLKARRPGREDIDERVERIEIHSGNRQRTFEQLKKAVERHPEDAHARLALADAEYADGNQKALMSALVESISAGADPSPIEGAIDLLEGITALEPYRLDGLQVIKEYEARNLHMSGTAARVLDYGAVWVNPDGSSRFLEHEIVRIQSEEAISRFAEESSHGLVLRLRVIKKDGSILEPEEVAGKPTVTMPHLEIGDYIETERIVSRWGDGLGEVYEGPGWYFRETDVAYARSEFVVIAPSDKELILETHNDVPEPEVTKTGSLVVYRYRVDESPAAPMEPMSPPAQEFLPSVSVGWGMSFDRRIRDLSRSMVSLSANDPRIIKVAENITKGKTSDEQKARALYHWVLDSVQDGQEQDGRRVVVSRNGNRFRGFETLCRALNIPVRWALAESRLASPIAGAIDSANRPLTPLLVVGTGKDQRFLTIDDKFAPYGTVPSFVRGETAYILGGWEAQKTKVPSLGSEDGVAYEGSGTLAANGDLQLDLQIIFKGTYAASLRNGLSQIPENQLGNVIESRLLAQELQGAELVDYKVLDQDQLDKPLIFSVKTFVPRFAVQTNVGMLINAPFMPRISQLTTLATRVTPLMIPQESVQSLDLSITLPTGASASVVPGSGDGKYADHRVADSFEGNQLHLVRSMSMHAGRVAPDEYAAFQQYTNQADAALSASIRLTGLGK